MNQNLFSAYLLKDFNSDLVLENNIRIEYPIPVNNIVVKLISSGICRSQLMEISGGRDNKNLLPHMLGHEGVGQVYDNPHNIPGYEVGQKLVLTWIRNREILNSSFPKYYGSNSKQINCGSLSTFSQFSCINVNQTIKIASESDIEVLASFGCSGLTGAGSVLNYFSDLPRETEIGIVGAGGIGLWALRALDYLGFTKIVVFESNMNRIKILEDLFHKFHYVTSSDISLKDKWSGRFENVFESSGSVQGIELGIEIANKRFGKCYIASHPPSGQKIRIDPHDLINGKKILGTWAGGFLPNEKQKEVEDFIKWISNESTHLFESAYSFFDLNKAIRDFRENRIIRPIILF